MLEKETFAQVFPVISEEWNSFLGAVADILDSLDDIQVLQESGRLTRSEILNAVDDYRLRAILEVRVFILNTQTR